MSAPAETTTATTAASTTTPATTTPASTSTSATTTTTTTTTSDAKETTAPAKTSRVYVSNLAFQTGWQELKDFFRDNLSQVEVGRVELLTNATGRSKGCAIVEFNTIDDAERAINELSGKELGGRTIYIREDREDKGFAGAEWKAQGSERVQSRSGRGRGRGGRGAYQGQGYSRGGGGYHAYGAAEGRPHVEREQTGGGDGTQVYVGNLPWRTAWQDLKDMFSQYGDVLRADVAEDRITRRSKGFGTVKFANAADAQAAIRALNDTELNGRQLIVRIDNYA